MAKFVGKIGFVESKETSPGIYMYEETIKDYYGDVIKGTRRWQESNNKNSDFIMSSTISVLADSYACNHLAIMRYVIWMGVKWSIESINIAYPRLDITLGGVYNENQT